MEKLGLLTRLSLTIPVRFDDDGLMLDDYCKAIGDVAACDVRAGIDRLLLEWEENAFPKPAVIRRYALVAAKERRIREDATRPKLVVLPDPDEELRGRIAGKYFTSNFLKNQRENDTARKLGNAPVVFEYTREGMYQFAREKFKVDEAFIERWRSAAVEDGCGSKTN